MKNSTKYRKPPFRRTRDNFIDDVRSEQNQRADLGIGRHLQTRRDKDKTKNVGITLYDIDFAIKSFVEHKMMLRVEDNGELLVVPMIYANSEKWASIQKNGFLKDKKGKTIVPLITFRRSGMSIKPEMKRNKVASTKQIAYVMQQRYNRNTPYDKFSTQYQKKRPYEYFMTPMPDFVDITYDFIVWCEYQNQLNHIIEQFIYFSGQAFGDKNFFKFSTNLDSLSIEDNNTSGQDRVVKSSFQLLVHGYLIPKDVAAETTTKRVLSANKIRFVSEMVGDINSMMDPNSVNYFGTTNDLNSRLGVSTTDGRNADGRNAGSRFRGPNDSGTDALDEFRRKVGQMIDISLSRSPDVYTSEIDDTD